MKKALFLCLLIFLACAVTRCASPKKYEYPEVRRINLCELYSTYTLPSFAKDHHAFGDSLSRYYNGLSTIVMPLGQVNTQTVSSTSVCALIDQYRSMAYRFDAGDVISWSVDEIKRDTLPKLFVVSLGPAKTPAAIYVCYQHKRWYVAGIVKQNGSQEDWIIPSSTELVSKARK